MSNELEKIKNFMRIKREPVEETIKDENSTKFAIYLIATSIILGVIQTLLQNLLTQDLYEWIVSYFGIAVPSVIRIISDAIANNIIFPIVAIVLVFYIGNALKGEADSLNHVIRAIGYSVPPLIISTLFSFLSLIPHIAVGVLVALVNVVFGLWFVITIIFALMLTFKKGALTAIGALIISAIITGIATSWTLFIP
ncbi:MAG: YIP1 family protein [Promethearchaeota archaeon]|jgi:hypothetical protein